MNKQEHTPEQLDRSFGTVIGLFDDTFVTIVPTNPQDRGTEFPVDHIFYVTTIAGVELAALPDYNHGQPSETRMVGRIIDDAIRGWSEEEVRAMLFGLPGEEHVPLAFSE